MESVKAHNTCINQCGAVVVTWQPDIETLAALLTDLTAQGCDVVVVDNGSDNAAQVKALVDSLAPEASMIPWQQNRGLSVAMNAGLQYLRENQYEFVFLFDQDSRLTDGFCESMLQAWYRACDVSSQPVGAVGPRLQDPGTGRRTPFRLFRLGRRSDCAMATADDLFEADFLISSGSLMSLSAVAAIGPMKDDYFIDNIDLEWCFRAKAKGYALVGTDAAILLHSIGEPSRNPLVRAGVMVRHSPARSYYSTRNRLHLYRQSYAPVAWKLRDCFRFVLKTAWLVLFSPQRGEYAAQIRRGIKDAGSLND
ncbi:hypothetical protein PHACT_07155 [Pseudohongiella acticola]|jgi:rhamnosyltransferase|uniref:Glycosyltransferase 2-like domain-containing protein n=1 Tax=Pseudohongiella acticola TaxID=1524254 RepID=A0A1E8CKL9_9GAMM|nr:hypothetical protein PHACT_07155 [Pseudohongiella acticola]